MTTDRDAIPSEPQNAESGFRWGSPVGIALAVLLLLLVVSRLANLSFQAFHHDESIHCLFSWKIVYEGLSSYRYDPVYHGPFLYFWGALGQKLLPDTDFFARVPYAMVGICLVLLFLAWRRVVGWGGVLLVMALLILSAPIDYFSRFARNDVYQVTWMAGQIVTVVLYLRTRRLRHLVFAAFFLALSYCTKENSYGHHGGLCLFLVLWGLWRLGLRYVLFAAFSLALSFAVKENSYVHYGGLILFLVFVVWGVRRFLRGLWKAMFADRLREIMVDTMPLVRLLILIGSATVFIFAYVGVDCRVAPETPLATGVRNIVTNFLSDEEKSDAKLFENQAGYFSRSDREEVRATFYRFAFGFTLALLIAAEGLSLWLRRERLRGHWTLHLAWAILFYGLLVWFAASLGLWARQAKADQFVASLILRAVVRVVVLVGVALAPLAFAKSISGGSRDKPDSDNLQVALAFAALALQVFLVVAIFLLLFSSLGANARSGVRDGLYEYVAYWLRHQTTEHRIWGVRWYYIPRLMLFEASPIILIVALGFGFLLRRLRGDRPGQPAPGSIWRPVPAPLLAFAGYWAVFLILLYAALNEKVTWLLTYQSFAVNLLAALLAAHYLGTAPRRRKGEESVAPTRRAIDLSLLGLLLAFTVGQHICTVYVRPDRATNLLVYTGTTHQFAQQIRRVERMRVEAGREGRKLRIGVHGQAEWPCAWYFRSRKGHERHLDVIWKTIDMKRDVQIMDSNAQNLRRVEGRHAAEWDVREVGQRGWWHWAGNTEGLPGGSSFWKNVGAFLTDAPNDKRKEFPEKGYIGARRSDATHFAEQVLSYVFLRRIWYPPAYHKVLFCYRTGQAAQIRPEDLPKVLKGADSAPRPLRGDLISKGDGVPNGFKELRGLAVTRDGNIAVVDSKNGRVVVLSPEGEPVLEFGNADLSAEYSGPCDVACAPDGSFYVVDTWNHVVRRYDARGKLVATTNAALRDLLQVGLWGPRGIAIGKDGRIYVTDTGNKYVCVYDADLHSLFSFGGPGDDRGMLSEPVGIAADAYGRVWVADTANGRLQLFDAQGRFQAEYQTVMPLEHERVSMEPHVTVLPDGRLAVTYSMAGQVWFIDPNRETVLVARIAAPRVEQPMGIDVDAQGRVIIGDRKSGKIVRVVPPGLPRPKPTPAGTPGQ